jgi:osmotically-inducible protein OsmY
MSWLIAILGCASIAAERVHSQAVAPHTYTDNTQQRRVPSETMPPRPSAAHSDQRARTPDELEFDVLQALLGDPATEAFQIQVQAGLGGAVTLSGEVDSWAERELAEQIARGTTGVNDVANLLDVRRRPLRSDDELEAEIEGMLERDAHLEGEDIDVEVKDGIVALSGTVESAAEKQRATSLAGVIGVIDITADSLQVRAGTK